MGDQHPNETAGPSRLPTDGSKTSDRAVASIPCDSTYSSSVEEMESEADFATFTSRWLKRKLRRTSSSRDSQPALDTGKQCFTISQDFEKTQNILKNLLKSIRAILCELQTPGAKAAAQILNVLEPLLVALP
ncbi:hypothetical protein HPB52_022227 [Rhipicephalus sanguineus]|uniref:Uncharacterized protein n=1 Tax=Rhipicephalus sanguineus TaxID=34632 RepID=A0A9D4TBU4_RHISA|nr:hypothetical protein HPB52_022227 [Rhipicephalus sanguineus]